MTLEQLEERVLALEKVVEQLQTCRDDQSEPKSLLSEEPEEKIEEDFIPGTEHDLIITVPPHVSFSVQGRIVRIETPAAELGLSDAEWALYGSEDEDE